MQKHSHIHSVPHAMIENMKYFYYVSKYLVKKKEVRKGLAVRYLAIPCMFDDILSVQLHTYLFMMTYANTFVSIVIYGY